MAELRCEIEEWLADRFGVRGARPPGGYNKDCEVIEAFYDLLKRMWASLDMLAE